MMVSAIIDSPKNQILLSSTKKIATKPKNFAGSPQPRNFLST